MPFFNDFMSIFSMVASVIMLVLLLLPSILLVVPVFVNRLESKRKAMNICYGIYGAASTLVFLAIARGSYSQLVSVGEGWQALFGSWLIVYVILLILGVVLFLVFQDFTGSSRAIFQTLHQLGREETNNQI